MCIRDSVSTPGNLSRTGKTRRHANILQSSLRSVSRRKTLAYREGSNCLAKSCTLIGCGSPEIIFFRLGFRPTIPFFSGISILGFCQLPNPKGLGRPLHRRFIVTCGCSGAIYCHSNTTLPIIFREWSRRFQGVRFISALQGLRVLYPLTPPSKYAGEELRAIIKKVRDGTFEYKNRDKSEINWAKYDYAQIKEMADYLNNIRDIVNEADNRIKSRTIPEKRGPGKPEINPADIAKLLLLQTYTESPNRVAEGLLFLFQEKLGISEHFSYKTIERGFDREKVNIILDEVVAITNECVKDDEKDASFDGTGFSASNKVNYADKRQKQNANKSRTKAQPAKDDESHDSFPVTNATSNKGFSYCVMGIGVKHKLISGMSVCANHSIGETTMFPDVFYQTLQSYPNLENALGLVSSNILG